MTKPWETPQLFGKYIYILGCLLIQTRLSLKACLNPYWNKLCATGWSFFLTFPFADSLFSLMNKATGFCLLKRVSRCLDLRWTTDDRLYVTTTKKCLGAQGKSIGSEVSLYDCDDKSDLQKWECRNGTLLALKNNNLFIEMKADETIALSKTTGPNNQFTITGTSSGACTRTYRGIV